MKPQLEPGSGGVFDVYVNGALIFSKRVAGDFPDPGDILRRVRQRRSQRS